MTAPCVHAEHVPLERVGRPVYGHESAPVIETTGHRCLGCGTVLGPGWGCEACTWLQVLLLVTASTTYVLANPCPTHERDHR